MNILVPYGRMILHIWIENSEIPNAVNNSKYHLFVEYMKHFLRNV